MRQVHGPRLLAAAMALALPACDGCHAKKPFTPYTLGDGPSDAGAIATSPRTDAGPELDAGAFTVVASTRAPGDGKSWPLEGGDPIEAPAGRTFGEGFVADLDGDHKPDLVAWAKGPDGLRGELWFAPGSRSDGGRTIAALPADLASPGCSAQVSLSLVGPRTVAFDFAPRCTGAARERAVRWIALVRLPAGPGGAPEIALELRLGAAAEGESLQAAIDPRDRDGDGRPDVNVTITLAGAPRPLPSGGTATATLAFFDRPAGLSRDPTEPEASLKALGASLTSAGRRKTTAAQVGPAALAARRLHTLLCEESGHAVISTSAGPVRCGEGRLAEESLMAEVEAQLNLGDPVGAAAALGRLDAVASRRKDLDHLLAKTIPTVASTRIRTTVAVPSIEPAPAFGPLAFTNVGDLLVRTKDRVIRVDRAAFDEAPVDPPLTWPTALAPGEAPAWKLTGVEERCDAATLIASFEAGDQKVDAPLPIATLGRCSATTRVPLDLLGTTSQGPLVAIRGDVIAIPMQAPPKPAIAETLASSGAVPLGASRSPDGTVIALPTSRGVLVTTLKGTERRASARFWTAPMTDGGSACVPSNAAERLACALPNGAALYEAK